MANKEEEEEGDFVSKNVSYMIQAIQGALSKDVIKSFGKLKTDAERFGFVWKLKKVQDVVVLEKEYEGKSENLAKSHRETGNRYFQQKSYLTALHEYNMGVLKAPVKGSADDDDAGGSGASGEGETQGKEVEKGDDKSDANKNDGENASLGEDGVKTADKESQAEKAKNELALVYANRSAALFHLKKYNECLEDIQLSIESGYAEESLYKLYERQGSCYVELGNQTEAVSSFTRAQELLSKANLDEKAQNNWIRTLNKRLSQCNQLNATDQKSDIVKPERFVPPRITGGPSTSHPNSSTNVRIQYNNIVGRHVTAGQDIKVGDVLMVDKPFASVLFPKFHKSHCYHCFVHVSVPIPCVQCCSIIFCSRQCRDASWTKFHQHECQYFALLDTQMCAKIGHLAVRLLMVLGLNTALDFVKQRENESNVASAELVGMNSDGIYSFEYDAVYDMVANSDRRPADQLFDFAVVSCLLVKVLQMSGYARMEEDSCDFVLLGGLLLRHLQIIQCNGLRIIELQQPNKFDETKAGELGIGLYPTAALVNHSCDPSADINFFGDSVVVRAIRNINQDEEVAISYGPLFYESKIIPRQSQLKGVYYFSCKCTACKEQWPVIEEMFDDAPKYRCGNCRANLTTEERFERKYFKCAKCQYKQDMEEVVGQLQSSFDVFAEAMNNAMSGNPDEALPKFVQHLLLLQRYIRQPWRDFCACQSAVKQCYRLQANRKL